MGKNKFDKKQAVRFALVPGPEIDGKPTVLYKPVQTHRSKLTKKERKNIITQLSDYDEITINGKKVNENEIPAYILEQISGRKDLVFNQKRQQNKEQEQEGDLYQIQDEKQQGLEDFYQYEDHDYDQEELQYIQEGENDDDDWQDEDEQMEEQIIEKQQTKVAEKYRHKDQDFPLIEELVDVQIEGITYKLTKNQAKLIDTIIPQNYEQLDFGGLQFKKYNEDGLLISEKEKYQKYFLKQNEKVVVIDTYEYVPPKPVDTVDNDIKPSQINGNIQLKEVEQALNYNGQQQIYEELQDDFFAKMIQMELQDKSNHRKAQNQSKQKKKYAKQQQVKQERQPKIKKESFTKQKQQTSVKTQKELEEQLQKAMFNFENNIEQQNNDIEEDEEEEEDESADRNHSMNFTDLEKREQYMGRDGQLDWRCLTKKQKKQYMKTKVIRQYYDELREREIEQKMQGKSNVTPEQLHLRVLVKHIPYQEDHVMKKALQEDLKVKVDLDASLDEEYSSMSSEDDIVSFHQKTSIIASNLSVIEQPKKKKEPKINEDKSADQNAKEFSIVKVVPEKRNKNETKQERKERKEKLKAQKKQKKQQKKQFAQQFSKIKRDMMKKQNPNNPLHKVAFVKIH